MFKWFKKKKNTQPTIEYIENKYGIKLTYPHIFTNFPDMKDPFYDELIRFGCSDIWYASCCIHRDCRRSAKISINLKTGEKTKLDDGDCQSCNFYPIVKEYEDSKDIKKIRKKKILKLNEQNSE